VNMWINEHHNYKWFLISGDFAPTFKRMNFKK